MTAPKGSIVLLLASLVIVSSEILKLDQTDEDPSCEDSGLGIHINLTSVGINAIRANFLASPLVKCLTLKDNAISTIDREAFKGLPSLLYLNLAGNPIEHEQFDCDWPTIETLILGDAMVQYDRYGYNYNERLPILARWPKLKKLYLRNNYLKSMSWNRLMPNITHLYLDDNHIDLHDLIGFIPSTLAHLSLSRNGIGKFAHSPILLQLEDLNLDGNRIQVLCYDYNCFQTNPQLPQDPDEPMKSPWDTSDAHTLNRLCYIDLRGATNLKRLSMARNRLKTIRDGAFTDLKSLEYLDLSNNLLAYIQPEAFRSAGNLTTLLLSNNQLKHLPMFPQLGSLETLMLDGNQITDVQAIGFQNLTSLQVLSLANNLITQVGPRVLEALPRLYELDLARNQLMKLGTNWLTPDTALRRLHLDNNLFVNIENMELMNVTDLEYLNIAGNPFQLLSVKSLIRLPENTVTNAESVAFGGDRGRRSARGF